MFGGLNKNLKNKIRKNYKNYNLTFSNLMICLEILSIFSVLENKKIQFINGLIF